MFQNDTETLTSTEEVVLQRSRVITETEDRAVSDGLGTDENEEEGATEKLARAGQREETMLAETVSG